MAYKTLALQIYAPSKKKRILMDTALLHYSEALQFLTVRYQSEIDALAYSGKPVAKRQLLTLIDRETSKELNRFHVQPFKDSLKMEFASLAAAYLMQKRNSEKSAYPLVFLDSAQYFSSFLDCIDRFDGRKISPAKFEALSSRLVERVDRLRPLYFGRYAQNRDYCLLYDEFRDRFYAKFYILNSADGYFDPAPASSLALRYIAEGMPALLNRPGTKRYLVVPLAFGKKQYSDLSAALEDPSRLHTARLLKKNGKYFLMVNIRCEPAPLLQPVTTMGISRGPLGGLNYSICDGEGKRLKDGKISVRQLNLEQEVYLFAKEIVTVASEYRSQVILEANGGSNDQIVFREHSAESCLPCGKYAMLARILRYKLPEKRLPPPVEVSANGLFLTCPVCQAKTRRNRITDELFACVECGYASNSEWIGCENLALRLIRYRNDKVPIIVSNRENSTTFFNKNLEFEFSLPNGPLNLEPMYEALDGHLKNMEGHFERNSKKYSIWKKLRQYADLRDVVRLVLK